MLSMAFSLAGVLVILRLESTARVLIPHGRRRCRLRPD